MAEVTRVRHPLRARLLEVRAVESLTPGITRITLGGDDLTDFRSPGADDHVKLLFAPDGGTPTLPCFEPGSLRYPAGAVAPVARNYTPRRFGPGELVIDFVIHGDGPASRWAASARPGSVVGQAGPRGSVVVSAFDWYLLAGDETALPAIARRLEELPSGAQATVIVEAAGALELRTDADLEVSWIERQGPPGTGDALAHAVRSCALPAGTGFAWFAGEADTARVVREHLRGERRLPRAHVRCTGYWKHGAADHHDPPEHA